MFHRSNRLVKFTCRVYGLWLWLIFYGFEFSVDFTSDFFGSSWCSILRVKCMCCVYGSNLWNMFTGRVYRCYFGKHFTRSNFMCCIFGLNFQSNKWINLSVVFMGWVYAIGLRAESEIRVFKPSLRIKCTSRVSWSSFRVEFSDPVTGWILPMSLWVFFYGWMSWVYKSRLRILFYRSRLMVMFTSQIYRTSFKIEVAVRD